MLLWIVALNKDKMSDNTKLEWNEKLKENVEVTREDYENSIINALNYARHIEYDARLYGKKCKRCDTTHDPKKCKAYGKICPKCNIKGHFADCCKTPKGKYRSKPKW